MKTYRVLLSAHTRKKRRRDPPHERNPLMTRIPDEAIKAGVHQSQFLGANCFLGNHGMCAGCTCPCHQKDAK